MKNKQTPQVNKGCSNAIGCLFFLPFIAGGGVFLLMSLPPSAEKPDVASSQPEASAPAYAPIPPGGTDRPSPDVPTYAQPQMPKPGTAGRLDYNGEPVLVATTEYAASQIANDIAASNTAALLKLEKSGAAYIVDDDTPITIVKNDHYLNGASVYHIRIEGGKRNGQDGWVPGDYVRE